MMKRIFSACLTFLMIAILSAVTVFAAMDSYDDGYMSIGVVNDDNTVTDMEIGLGCINSDDYCSGSASTSTYSLRDFSAYSADVTFDISFAVVVMDRVETLADSDIGLSYAYASASFDAIDGVYEYAGAFSSHTSSVVNNDDSSDIRSGWLTLSS